MTVLSGQTRKPGISCSRPQGRWDRASWRGLRERCSPHRTTTRVVAPALSRRATAARRRARARRGTMRVHHGQAACKQLHRGRSASGGAQRDCAGHRRAAVGAVARASVAARTPGGLPVAPDAHRRAANARRRGGSGRAHAGRPDRSSARLHGRRREPAGSQRHHRHRGGERCGARRLHAARGFLVDARHGAAHDDPHSLRCRSAILCPSSMSRTRPRW